MDIARVVWQKIMLIIQRNLGEVKLELYVGLGFEYWHGYVKLLPKNVALCMAVNIFMAQLSDLAHK